MHRIQVGIRWFIGAWLLTSVGQANSGSFSYSTSFEQPTFTPGNLGPGGLEGWDVAMGACAIQDSTSVGVRSGFQGLMIQPLSRVERAFSGVQEANICIDGYYHGPVVDVIPDPHSLGQSSSVILFHATEGIMALDGDGAGGGVWRTTGLPASPPFLRRITILQDYVTKIWTFHIDGISQLAGKALGFRDNSINELSSIFIQTSVHGEGFLDDFAVNNSTTVPHPSNCEYWEQYE